MSARSVEKLDVQIIKHEGKNQFFTVNCKTFSLKNYHIYKHQRYFTEFETKDFEYKLQYEWGLDWKKYRK